MSQYIHFLLPALLMSLASCGVPPSPTPSPTSTLAPPTWISSPTVIPSLTPSPGLPTPAHTPSPIPPTQAPHPTPAPTLTADEEQALVLSLIQGNKGCRLPCWWGFVPGETHWQTAETIFALQGKEAGRFRDSQHRIVFDIRYKLRNEEIYQYYFVNNGTIDLISVRAVPPIRDDKFVYGDAQFAEDLAPYMLPQMLVAYGRPTQVLLGLYRDVPWLPFDLLLFYPEQGILVRYSGPAERGEEKFQTCPHQAEVTLWLWSSEQSMTLEDIPGLDNNTADGVSDFRFLEEATGMSIEKFYETFSIPDDQTCLETPADMW